MSKEEKANRKARKDREQRRHNLAVAIDLTWESLRSHLGAAVKADERANEEWQARCVRGYTKIMDALATELHELAKIDFKDAHTALCAPLHRW